MPEDLRIEPHHPPVEDGLARTLLCLWNAYFPESAAQFPRLGCAPTVDRDHVTIYVARARDRIVGTCCLSASPQYPGIGGIGEVLTIPSMRGRGVATALLSRACDGFRSRSGEAVFLATGNPSAARVYARLGWRHMAGTKVMLRCLNHDSPDHWLVEFARTARERAEYQTSSGAEAAKMAMVPLIITPHEWQVMDANTHIISVRHAVQASCMGLYPRYQRVATELGGAWFAATVSGHGCVGLATAVPRGPRACTVDGFALDGCTNVWERLMDAATGWAEEGGADDLRVLCSTEDAKKQRRFEDLGFERAEPGAPIEIGERQVESVWLRRPR